MVYAGETVVGKDRVVTSYIAAGGGRAGAATAQLLGPRGEPRKMALWRALQAVGADGMAVALRAVPAHLTSKQAEALLLDKWDFPLNAAGNGGYRQPILGLQLGKAVALSDIPRH